ncbi:MAG TPA: hypothetical protein VG742_23180 [Dongiaceae bacterium]|nr:hypothetical protein [Dongiaceae bacterium]
MWGVQHVVRTLVALGRRRHKHIPAGARGPVTDWLPPVLGPGDWPVGLMADREAGWYFDRN